VCALAWLAFTCGGDEPAAPTAEYEAESSALAPPEELDPARLPGDPPRALRGTLDGLRQAARAPRHPSDGGGRAWLEPDSTVPAHAGQSGHWTIGYETGPAGIAAGGFVRLTV